MKKTGGSVLRLYYGLYEKAGSVLLSSRTPAQANDILLVWYTQDISYIQKLFLICALTSPNPEKCVHKAGRLSRLVTWFVTHIQKMRLASAKLGAALLQARSVG